MRAWARTKTAQTPAVKMAMSANAAIKPTPIPQQSRRDDEALPKERPLWRSLAAN